ncbi:B12-binding domain-containing radical SAM protein [Chloroflexota bacterium]
MKTLLINPNTPKIYDIGGARSFPLGLGYVAAVLEAHNEVMVIDVGAEGLSNDTLSNRITEIMPEIVGITSDSITFQRSIEIAELVKLIDKETIVVIGGAHANVWPTYPLKYECFDISVYGEGEQTVVELWNRIESGNSYEDIKGIAFKGKNGIVVNPKRELIENLDELPFPARHLFPMDKYGKDDSNLHVSPVYSIGTSRGCPFMCAFCSNNVVFGRKFRSRSPKNIVDELHLLINQYQAKGIYFREDIFTANKQRIISICNEIKTRGLHFEWECESRINTVDEEMLKAMKEAGCKLTWFGIENGSQRILDYLHKQITLQQIRKTYSLCKSVGIKAGASFLIGVPGETINDIHHTISFAKELKAEFAWFNIFTGYPTSPLYEYVRKNNLYEREIGHGVLVIKTEEFGQEELKKIQEYAHRTTMNRKRLFNIALSQIKDRAITPQKVIRGIKYILRQ